MPIRVVVVDDSPSVCRVLARFLHSSEEVQVVATVHDGGDALAAVARLRPDVVTLDLQMPGMGGLEALTHIMRECPTPVVAISGMNARAAKVALEALERGAVDFVFKYTPGLSTDPAVLCREIVSKVKAAARMRLVTAGLGGRSLPITIAAAGTNGSACPPQALIVIGSSTGGPLALRELLNRLPRQLNAAVVVVQHLPAAFTSVLASQLHRQTSLTVREAEDGMPLAAGEVIITPGDSQLEISSGARVRLRPADAGELHCPCIDVTLRSAAALWRSRLHAVLLTGMGDDGVQGLAETRHYGGRTYVQEPATCVVAGMTQRALDRALADHVASPAELGVLLGRLAIASPDYSSEPVC